MTEFLGVLVRLLAKLVVKVTNRQSCLSDWLYARCNLEEEQPGLCDEHPTCLGCPVYTDCVPVFAQRHVDANNIGADDLLGKGGSVIKTCPICRITKSVVPPEHNGVCVVCEDKLADGCTAEAIAAQSASFLAVQAIKQWHSARVARHCLVSSWLALRGCGDVSVESIRASVVFSPRKIVSSVRCQAHGVCCVTISNQTCCVPFTIDNGHIDIEQKKPRECANTL